MSSRMRKRLLLERAEPVPEPATLSIEIHELLYAFELAAPHVKKGGTYASRRAEQQELALGLIDWAICESDRGAELLKAKTKPDEMAGR